MLTFFSLHKPPKQTKGKSPVRSKEKKQIERAVSIARDRGITMDVLLEYKITESDYLLDKDGLPTKADKSALVRKLEEQLDKDDVTNFCRQSEHKTAYLVDVMANIRKIKIKENKTFGNFCKSFFSYVFTIGQETDRIDFVFDSYMEGSIKDSERRRRQKVAAIDLNDIENSTPLPVEMDRFWGSSNNKLKLQMLIHTEVLEQEMKKNLLFK